MFSNFLFLECFYFSVSLLTFLGREGVCFRCSALRQGPYASGREETEGAVLKISSRMI